MAEVSGLAWLYEDGIGEARAALIEDGRIVEALIEVEATGPRAGSVVEGRLATIAIPLRRGVVTLGDGIEVLVEPLPRAWTQGASVRIEIVRETIPERDAIKRAKARPADGLPPTNGLALRARIAATGHPVRDIGVHYDDVLEELGWSELLESAQLGVWPFPGGTLRIIATPAMTLVDVDGHLDPPALAVAAARASARAIRALGIAGSVGIDFPTLGNKAERLAAAEAFDADMPQPYERTAINGFGFMQIVRPRQRASLIEALAIDPAGHAARALLRRAERSGLIGATTLVAHPRVVDVLSAHPVWRERLGRHLGGAIGLRADVRVPMSGGYAEA